MSNIDDISKAVDNGVASLRASVRALTGAPAPAPSADEGEQLEAELKTIRNLADAQLQSVRMIEARALAISQVVGIILEARARRLAVEKDRRLRDEGKS
jgi:hypothetical protein